MNPVDYLAHDRLAIFLFHGVVNGDHYEVRNYTRKHLLRDRFYQVIQSLASRGTPMSMNQVVQHHVTETPWPSRAFAVTFDDGFENNYSVAAPILHHFRVPATFYVTTGFVANNAMSWIDRIEFCLERVRRGRVTVPWSSDPWEFSNTAGKIDLLNHLRSVAKRDPTIDVDALASSVAEQCGLPCPTTSHDPLDLKLSWSQVQALHEDPLFEVGGHTHSHAVLAYLSPAELEREVATSLDLLAEQLRCRPCHYTYPQGLRHCYSDEVIATLKAHGVLCCPSAQPGTNALSEDLFHLRRIAVV